MSNSNEKPKSFVKAKEGQVTGFKMPSRFGGNAPIRLGKGPQFKPSPVRITQHKG